jgi:putative Mg2+ transporter-C (MgtC) family protein
VVCGIGFLGAGSIVMRGGMYSAPIAATIIVLIIPAGIRSLERRFITVKQPRRMMLLVGRDSLTFHSLHDAPGAASLRVKQFVMQQGDDATDYAATRLRRRQLPWINEFREDDSTSEIGDWLQWAGVAMRQCGLEKTDGIL